MNVAVGAAARVAVVLFATGPGTLFPIALAIGLTVVVTASVGGALAGGLLRGGNCVQRPHVP